MKVKIGNTIYDSIEEPIMLILDQEDKENISNMLDECTKYLSYPDNMSEDDARTFMII